jgi:hypothetical protein
VSEAKPTRKQSSSVCWNRLQSSKQAMTNHMPEEQTVYSFGMDLEKFLEDEGKRLEISVKENGEFILHFLSLWEDMNEYLKQCGYKKLFEFLNAHAENCKMFKSVGNHDPRRGHGQQHDQRRSQVLDAVSSSSVHRLPPNLRRSIAKFRHNTLNEENICVCGQY